MKKTKKTTSRPMTEHQVAKVNLLVTVRDLSAKAAVRALLAAAQAIVNQGKEVES
jgi:hypothetical protein